MYGFSRFLGKKSSVLHSFPYPWYRVATDEEIFTKSMFWDVDLESLDKKKNARFIIARVLEHGDLEHMNWLFKTYPKEQIVKVIKNSLAISPKVANYWKIKLNIKGKIRCLDPQYLKMRKKIWPH